MTSLKLKDFQEAAAQRIYELFRYKDQRRVLLADEVGLGKTIIARAVVDKVKEWHREKNDNYFRVVYICSNQNIAQQNCRKLGIKPLNIQDGRLSMQHLHIVESERDARQMTDGMPEILIPMTPATSFITEGHGTYPERALMFVMLRDYLRDQGIPTKSLKELLKVRKELNWWDEAIKNYEERVKDVLTVPVKSGEQTYHEYIHQSLASGFARRPELLEQIRQYTTGSISPDKNQSRPVIGGLREIFADLSLQLLEPDLVIMDEFQRFRDLISLNEATEAGRLSRHFLNDDSMNQELGTKVLLLSATPYKPFTTMAELAEGQDSSKEFQEVMRFLLYKDGHFANFTKEWANFSRSLRESQPNDWPVVRVRKDTAETRLRSCISRTERRNDSLIDTSKAREMPNIPLEEIRQFIVLQKLMNRFKLGRFSIEIAKSAPWLMSFMRYKVREKIEKHFNEHFKSPAERKKHLPKKLFLNWGNIHAYSELPESSAKLQRLEAELFSTPSGEPSHSELLLWIPPTFPYYRVSDGRAGKYFEQNRGFSKVLIFSAWEVVPRVVSALISYESEQKVFAELNKHLPKKFKYANLDTAQNAPQSGTPSQPNPKKKRRRPSRIKPRLRDEAANLLTMPCRWLAELWNPQRPEGKDLNALEAELTQTIQRRLDTMPFPEGEVEPNAPAFCALLKALDAPQATELPPLPRRAAQTLAHLALGSPAICLQRIIPQPDKLHDPKTFTDCCSGFLTLFNRPETMAILDLIYGTRQDSYWENVLLYCMEGNLQAVLDEMAFLVPNSDELSRQEEFTRQLDQALSLRTAIIECDTPETFLGQSHAERIRFRSHYAVGFFNRQNTDKTIARAGSVRDAFNSPFRPFVLTTTSIGQEGLDFHAYCRKIFHWNLPSNPIDLEQREGRINRYLSLAIRQSLAAKWQAETAAAPAPESIPTPALESTSAPIPPNSAPPTPSAPAIWPELLQAATAARPSNATDLVPCWCLPETSEPTTTSFAFPIERIVPLHPFSRDVERYHRLLQIISLYRLTLGQPRQEELIDTIRQRALSQATIEQLILNLSPLKPPSNSAEG